MKRIIVNYHQFPLPHQDLFLQYLLLLPSKHQPLIFQLFQVHLTGHVGQNVQENLVDLDLHHFHLSLEKRKIMLEHSIFLKQI